MAFASLSRDPGFGVYVHWPFCAAKCPYCDFNSHVRHQPVDQERFARAFSSANSANMRARTGPREVTSVFLGGGTPSLMRPETVGAVLEAIAGNWTIADSAEITLEANPSSVEAERFRGYRAAGVNRVSLGVQALNDAGFALPRAAAQCRGGAACDRTGTRDFSAPVLRPDLCPTRPEARMPGRRSSKQAIGYAADHLSLYQLTIEEGTRFHALHAAASSPIPDGEHAAELYAMTQDVTAARGLPAYEISNHARPGAESRHNLVYWRYGEYVGIGPGAHGRFVEEGRASSPSPRRLPETWANLVEAKWARRCRRRDR
jgi:putative oxygen-independent coproporphyrinogen III oxidase